MMKVLFLDLDGTLRVHKNGAPFINKAEDALLLPDVETILWAYRNAGWHFAIITNQAGVAFGHTTVEEVSRGIEATLKQFHNNPFQDNDFIGASYTHPDSKLNQFRARSTMRKPGTGLISSAEIHFHKLLAKEKGVVAPLDLRECLFVGDRPEDYECAKNAGIPFEWSWKFFSREEPDFEKDPWPKFFERTLLLTNSDKPIYFK